MPVTHYRCDDYEKFKETISELEDKDDKRIYVLFSGSKDKAGVNWCPDCQKAEPVVEEYLSSKLADKNIHFIEVRIQREIWKDLTCKYRIDPKLKVSCVPTLIKWGGPERLEEAELLNKNMLDLLFEDC